MPMANYQRLAQYVKARRVELGLRQSDLGVSAARVSQTERGEHAPLSDLSSGAICKALGWAPGSIDRILRGEEPVLVFDRTEVTSAGKAITGLTEAEWSVLEATLTALRRAT
jgi:transcriptional regulator with XRE-family HTH domain